MKLKNIYACAFLFIVTTNCNASVLDSIKDVQKIKDLVEDKKKEFSNIDLESLGIGGLKFDDVTNINLSAFKGFLTAKCAVPTLPSISESFCSDLLNGQSNLNFGQNLNLGLCSVSVGGGGYTNQAKQAEESHRKMAIEMCQKLANGVNYLSQSTNKYIGSKSSKAIDAIAPAETVKINSKYAEAKEIELNDYSLPNGKKNSDLIKPSGDLGFDNMLDNVDTIPKSLRSAYFSDNYALYSIYEKFAKTATPESNGKIDFNKVEPSIPETYLDYVQETQVEAKETFVSVPTIYEIEKKLNNEYLDLVEQNPIEVDGSSSVQMKASLLSQKRELLDEFTSINFTNEERAEANKRVLAKALNSVDEYLNVKFAEDEDKYRYEKGYIVNPSKLKADALSSTNKIIYADKVRRQQTDEVRRMANFMRQKKNQKELVKLLAEKVFIANFEFKSEIAQKEIDEILSQANTN